MELLKSNLYMEYCHWCVDIIDWSDMDIALWGGKCPRCVYQKEKVDRE